MACTCTYIRPDTSCQYHTAIVEAKLLAEQNDALIESAAFTFMGVPVLFRHFVEPGRFWIVPKDAHWDIDEDAYGAHCSK